MNQDGTGATNVSNDAKTANEFNPAYGPDGSIVFVRAAAGTFNICASSAVNRGNLWVRNPDGTTRQLTNLGADNTPAWSPDGTKIAFTRISSGGPHIFVMNADGTGTPTDLGPGVKPNWSPDGSKITFAAPGGANGPTGGPVMVMDASGANRVTVNANGTAPVWSPDGTQISYIAFDPKINGSVIGVMDANGQNQHNVTNPGSGNSDVKPDWQPVIRGMLLRVKPHNVTAHKRVCIRFRLKSSGQPVAGASVRFAHHHKLTGAKGGAKFCLKLRPGRHRATATKPGYRTSHASVRGHATKQHTTLALPRVAS
jgi:Tol biopolymer transport system component